MVKNPTSMNDTMDLGRSCLMLDTASSPFSLSRQASMTSLPPSHRYRATSYPIPELPPVTIITRPVILIGLSPHILNKIKVSI